MLEHAVRLGKHIAGTITSNCRQDFLLIGNLFFMSLDTARTRATLIVSYDKLSRILIAWHCRCTFFGHIAQERVPERVPTASNVGSRDVTWPPSPHLSSSFASFRVFRGP